MSTRLKSTLDVVSSMAVILAAGVLIWRVAFASSAAGPAREAVQRVDNVRLVASQLSHVTGAGDVVIVEFTDFQCPFCGSHARETLPTLRTELIDSGKARYASINFPIERIHPRAVRAAQLAECAGEQGKFWEMHGRLFSDTGATAEERFDEHVRSVGLDASRLTQCMSSDRVVAKVRGDQMQGQRLGVIGTPAFFVGRLERDGDVTLLLRINGARGAEVFAKAVEDVRSGNLPRS